MRLRLRPSTSPPVSSQSMTAWLFGVAKRHFSVQLANRRFLAPFRLLLLSLVWIPPYFLYSNYLEAYLLPLRLLCYTQSDLLSKEPVSTNFEQCVSRLFGGIRKVDEKCGLDKVPEVLIRPALPEHPSVLLVIRTGPGSIHYRNFIRNSWKSKVEKYFPVIFVCATSPNFAVLDESNKYKDILQFNFEDSYHNLSWKMMSIYGFVLSELPSVQRIVVINDDTIVNATALSQLVTTPSNSAFMLGKVSRGYPRIFLPWLTWHVDGEMYPNLCYPLFIQGSSFILSRSGAQLLFESVCKVPFFHLDDVFMGIIANCVGLELRHNTGFDVHEFDREFVVYHYQYSRHSAKHLQSLWDSSSLK